MRKLAIRMLRGNVLGVAVGSVLLAHGIVHADAILYPNIIQDYSQSEFYDAWPPIWGGNTLGNVGILGIAGGASLIESADVRMYHTQPYVIRYDYGYNLNNEYCEYGVGLITSGSTGATPSIGVAPVALGGSAALRAAASVPQNLCIWAKNINMAGYGYQTGKDFFYANGLLNKNKIAPPSCGATSLSWGAGGLCKSPVSQTGSGGTLTLTNSQAGVSGVSTATCSGGTWAQSNSVCTADLTAPTGFQATDGTIANGINFTWDSVPYASTYTLYAKSGASWISLYSGSATSYNATGMPSGTVIEFKIRGENAAGPGPESGIDTGYAAKSCSGETVNWGPGDFCGATTTSGISGTLRDLTNDRPGATGTASLTCNGVTGSWGQSASTCNASLSAPASVAATDGTVVGKITVTWGAVANATGYDIRHRKQGAPSWTTVSNVTSGWQLTTADESVFEFQVVGKNVAGEGTWSGTETGNIAKGCATQTLNWGPSNYCAASAAAGIQGTSRTLTNTTSGGSGGATAVCNGLTGSWELSATTCTANLSTPVAVSATQGTLDGAIKVTWGATPGALSYELQHRKAGDANWVAAGTVSSGWQLTIADAADHQFQVRAVNSVGTSGWSTAVTGWAQRCAAASIGWGTANMCSGNAQTTANNGTSSLINMSPGATGTASAVCTNGAWVVGENTCLFELSANATDGTIEDAVNITWEMSYTGGGSVTYDLFRDEESIATGITPKEFLDSAATRGAIHIYKVQVKVGGVVVGEITDTGFIPECRAARFIGASLSGDMASVNGLIEQWQCLSELNATRAIDAAAPEALSVSGSGAYKSFSIPLSAGLADGNHVVHLTLESVGVGINSNRTFDIPFTLNRASIAVKNLSIIYNGSLAVNGLEANSIGRFGVRMDGGSGIGFAEEVK